MEFNIIIDFNIDSSKDIKETIEYEYYKKQYKTEDKDPRIFCDIIEFTKDKIVIKGNRTKIDIENCWKTRNSNYRRCILSSLFYLYNYFKKEIQINSIKMSIKDKEVDIPFIQEFSSDLIDRLSLKLEKMEYLFKTTTYSEMSNLLFRILHCQIKFVNEKNFYHAYKAFNSLYTFYISYHNDLLNKLQNKHLDKDAIVALLSLKNIDSYLPNSLILAEDFFNQNSEEFYKSIFLWMLNESVDKNSFSGKIWYDQFGYENINVLNLLKKIIIRLYKVESNFTSILPKFNGKFNRNSNSRKINYLQLIIAFSNYRRNKLLHGEYIDSDFLIPDLNAQTMEKISEIIFQLAIDLTNNIERDAFEVIF